MHVTEVEMTELFFNKELIRTLLCVLTQITNKYMKSTVAKKRDGRCQLCTVLHGRQLQSSFPSLWS
jgi:hypothetical protein